MMIRVNFVSLGCAKNLVDSERLLAILGQAGMVLVAPDDETDVTIINTCSFIEEARNEAFEAIERALECKTTGQVRYIAVTGCLAQHWGTKVLKRYPDIDAVVGLSNRDQIAHIVRRVVADTHPAMESCSSVYVEPFGTQVTDDRSRLRLTDRCWSYLRISEGCSRVCSFCTIPRIRGPYRSKGPEMILAEAEELVADGALELNLIGQETSNYGKDIGYPGGLAQLLRELDRVDGLRWLRVLYTHPASMSRDLIDTIAACENVVAYVDMPLQHINNRILERMRRDITREETEAILQRLRETVPGIAIRTTLMVGFPSETDEEFDELLAFVREQKFDALGGFMYSAEPGTRASHLQQVVPQDIKRSRHERMMLAQQEVAFSLADQTVGGTVDCLVCRELGQEEVDDLSLDDTRRWYVGRHSGQAPEMDSECFIGAETELPLDTIAAVTITGRIKYDLVGQAE